MTRAECERSGRQDFGGVLRWQQGDESVLRLIKAAPGNRHRPASRGCVAFLWCGEFGDAAGLRKAAQTEQLAVEDDAISVTFRHAGCPGLCPIRLDV